MGLLKMYVGELGSWALRSATPGDRRAVRHELVGAGGWVRGLAWPDVCPPARAHGNKRVPWRAPHRGRLWKFSGTGAKK
jgi:hypothetical protein